MNINEYDSKIVDLVDKIYEEKRNMSEEVFSSLSRLKDMAYEQGDDALRGFAHFHLADSLFAFEKDWDEFRGNLAKSIYFFIKADEKTLLARAYNFVALDGLENGSFDVAYLYLMNALQTCEGLEDYYLFGIINNNLGQVYSRMHSHEKALGYMRISLEMQTKSSSGDLYYHQNMINGYFSQGVMHCLMDNVEEAKAMERRIAELEKEPDVIDNPSVFNPTSMLRLMISILEGDEENTGRFSRSIVETLKKAHGIYDYMTDIEDFCGFLLEHDRLETVGEILKILENAAQTTSLIQMKKIFSSMQIAYYEKLGDEEKVNEHLYVQYGLIRQQQAEQDRIYQFSIELIDIMKEHYRENEKVRLENEMLQSQAMTDPLTGIPNRLMLDRTMPSLFEVARDSGRSFAVSLMDIDKFKSYNDNYGHLSGDICLQLVAEAIRDVSDRSGVHCARYGGDEFVMIYENKSDEEIMNIANELSLRIYELDIAHSSMGETGRVSVSQGICNCIPGEDDELRDFINEADNALYAVKKNLDRPDRKGSVRLIHL